MAIGIDPAITVIPFDQRVTFNIVVANYSRVAAQNVTVLVAPSQGLQNPVGNPPALPFMFTNAPGWRSCTEVNVERLPRWVCVRDSIDPGAAASITLALAARSGSVQPPMTLSAAVTSDTPDYDHGNNFIDQPIMAQ